MPLALEGDEECVVFGMRERDDESTEDLQDTVKMTKQEK